MRRHACGIELLRPNEESPRRAAHLRHRDIQTTAVYATLVPDELVEAASAFDRALGAFNGWLSGGLEAAALTAAERLLGSRDRDQQGHGVDRRSDEAMPLVEPLRVFGDRVIELPVSRNRGPAAPDQAAERLTPIGAKRLLVVDDEPDIASVLYEILNRDGHHVDTAGEGAAALGLIAQRSYDLVLTDTKMPGLDGIGFFQEIERRFPALKGRVVFLTGDLLARDRRELLESIGAPVLSKPFDVDEVRRLVHRILRPA